MMIISEKEEETDQEDLVCLFIYAGTPESQSGDATPDIDAYNEALLDPKKSAARIWIIMIDKLWH